MQNTGTMTDTTALNSLLRGEMSAIETYRQAIEKFESETGIDQLQSFRKDHRDAADALWHHIERHGGKPSEGSGPWGTFAKAVEGTAKLLGNAAALKALKEGEEHGLKDYQDALDSGNLPADCRDLLLSFVPRMRQHVQVLDGLISKI
jgi:uncharacterized protein (TIGR02284 family)